MSRADTQALQKRFEAAVIKAIEQAGYRKATREEFDRARGEGARPVYARRYPAGTKLYGGRWTCDLILYHPERHRGCLVVMTRWQKSSGSVDEKFPFLVLTINENAYPAMIVLGGDGFSKRAVDWLQDQASSKMLRAVLGLDEFLQLASTGEL